MNSDMRRLTGIRNACKMLCAIAFAMAPLVPSVASAAVGSALYATNCSACHGAEAKGGIGPDIQCNRSIMGQVRKGGGAMRPFPPAVLSNADVAAIQGFLTDLCAPPPATTTTTLPTGPPTPVDCSTLDACRASLAAVLPSVKEAHGRSKGIARKLARLKKKADHALVKAAQGAGKHPEKQQGKARTALTGLVTVAAVANDEGVLNVSLDPILDAVNGLLDLIPGGDAPTTTLPPVTTTTLETTTTTTTLERDDDMRRAAQQE